MKLHLGCGRVYLKGFVNIDGSADYMADICPASILQGVMTDEDNYYKMDFNKLPQHSVADMVHDLTKPLPYHDETVDEVRMEQVLEHMPIYLAGNVVEEIYRVLKPGGSFVVGVPDIRETARMMAEAKTDEEEDWAIRLIYGTQRNKYSHHYCGFVPRTLKAFLADRGFSDFEDLPSINVYPVVRLRAFKRGA